MRAENYNEKFYSFGMQMPGRTYSSPSYRYGFNGKEKIDEIEGSSGATYDYGFRIYDPRLGRFLSVDPLTRGYPWYSPYHFAGNKPIIAIDLDGLEEKIKTLVDYHMSEAMLKQMNATALQAEIKSQVVSVLVQDAFDKLPEADKKSAGAYSVLTAEISKGIDVFVQTKEVKHFDGTITTEVVQIVVTPSGYNEKKAEEKKKEEKTQLNEKIKDVAIEIVKTGADILDVPIVGDVPTEASDVPKLLVTILGGAGKLASTIGLVFTPTSMGTGDVPLPPMSPVAGKGTQYLNNLFGALAPKVDNVIDNKPALAVPDATLVKLPIKK